MVFIRRNGRKVCNATNATKGACRAT